MKKVFALAMVILLALSLLTACGGNGGGNSGNSSSNNRDDADRAKDLIDGVIDAYGGGTQEERDEIKEAIGSMSDDWPADKLPSGMPVYPDGKIVTAMNVDGAEVISISDTTGDSFRQYIETLKTDGWAFSDDSGAELIGVFEAAKGEWETVLMKINENTIMLTVTRTEENGTPSE